MYILSLQAVFFALPFVLAGLIHVAVIKFGLLKSLEVIPLDGGAKINGLPVFGKNKTLRGAVTVMVSVATFFLLEGIAVRRFPVLANLMVVNLPLVPSLAWGLLLGIGCIIGELPNSFLKRRLNIAPGAESSNVFLKILFWVLDQIDSLLGVLVVAGIYWKPSGGMIIALLIITIVIHPTGTAVMIKLGLKRGSLSHGSPKEAS